MGLRTHRLRIFIRLADGLGASARRILARWFLTGSRLAGRGASRGPGQLTLQVLGVDGTVSRAAAVVLAERLGRQATTTRPTAIQAARLCLELGDPAAADRILDDLAGADPDHTGALLRAEIAWQLGRYRQAADRAEELLRHRPSDRDARRVRDWSLAELTVLEPGWRPRLEPLALPPTPTPGRVLHLLTNSVPYRQAGYTVRTQSVGWCQQAVGLDPQMATRAGFPRSAGVRGAPASDEVDGVTYWRLAPDLELGTGPVDVAVRTADAARALVERLRPAALQPTSNHLNALVALALRDRYRIPVVYEVRGFLEETWRSRVGEEVAESDRYRATRAAETAAMREADAIVTLSETMRADILARGGVEAGRIVVVPNAVDVARFLPGPRDAALAARLGLGDEPVIGYISSFTAYEGIRYLIEATAELHRRGRRVRCLLVGDGEERLTLEAVARSADLPDGSVVFAGRVPHGRILDYYRLIDVFVVPRTNDRVSQLVTPLKPYEAMATERALVVSGVAALREIVVEGETGRTFTPEDPISLADVLEPLLDDPAERARLGSAARRWVAANRTWEQNGQRYLALYRELGAA